MTIYGSFVYFVMLTMRKQKDRPKWRKPPSQKPTKILSSHGQAQHEISAKTPHVCKLTPPENSIQFCLPLEVTSTSNQVPKPN